MNRAAVGVEPWSDRIEWDRFVAASPHGSVFCRSEFLDALGVGWGVVRVGSGESPAAAAVVLRDPSGEVPPAPFPYTQYQGVLLGAELSGQPAHRRVRGVAEAVTTLVAGVAEQGAVSWCLHPDFPDIRPFSWFNFHLPERGRFQVDVRYAGIIPVGGVTSVEEVLESSRSVRRQEFRKARDRFVVVGSEDLGLLDELHARTFARQGLERPPADGPLLRDIGAAALRSGFGEMFAAFDRDGQPAGAVLFLFDQRAAYYLVAAHDPQFRSTGVSTLLFLAGVERGLRRGVEWVDVVGMNSPGRSDFKASFGAVPKPYYVVRWQAR